MRSSKFAMLGTAMAGLLAGIGAIVHVPAGVPKLHRVAPACSRSRGPGWGVAQVKRMARKRRNVLANRRAHRG